jgi:FkbM family methyltransferase
MAMNNESVSRLIATKLFATVMKLLPNEQWRCRLRGLLISRLGRLPESLLCSEGETVVMVGVHRIDTAMRWSRAVGAKGRIVLVEAVPKYLDNIRENLEKHFNWHLSNIVYVATGVSAEPGVDIIEIGRRADFNKLAKHGVQDDLPEDAFVDKVEVQVARLEDILTCMGIDKVDHVTLTISGLELEALRGMERMLANRNIRLFIRSLHAVSDRPLYLDVVRELRQKGFNIALGRAETDVGGRNIYAYALAEVRSKSV